MIKRTATVVQMLVLSVLVTFAGPTGAQQAYPSRPIHFITPFPPGGSLDPMTRMAAQQLSERWGQPGIVENRPGGNSIIGTDAVAKAAPDGYTILVVGSPHVINPSLFPTPYDAIKDFDPIATIAMTHQVLVINPSVPVNTVQELVALAKAKPGQLNFSSSGTGNTNHLAAELFSMLTGIKMLHVPYKGAGPAVTDLIGGQVQLSFHVPISVIAHIKSGRLKAIAITGQTRASALPTVPTLAESGLAGFETEMAWFGMLAPAGTPKNIIDKMSSEMGRIVATADVREKLVSQGLEPFYSTPEQYAALLKSDMAKYAKIIKAANIKVEQ